MAYFQGRGSTLKRRTSVSLIILRFPVIVFGLRPLDQVAALCGVMWEKCILLVFCSNKINRGGERERGWKDKRTI